MITKAQRRNAERIVALADTFGSLEYNDHGQTVERILNLSIPTARLIVADVVTGVRDTCDGVNDDAVAELEQLCAHAVEHAERIHGRGWWNDVAKTAGLPINTA